jgi:protein PhnA
MYLDTLAWAQATGEGKKMKIKSSETATGYFRSGDSVVLIKDLKSKGSSMVAKQGNCSA